MFHESWKNQFNWNLMLRYTVKLTLNYYFMKYYQHFMKCSERKVSQGILPFKLLKLNWTRQQILLGNSPETMQKLCLFAKFSREEITWNDGILCNVYILYPVFTAKKLGFRLKIFFKQKCKHIRSFLRIFLTFRK